MPRRGIRSGVACISLAMMVACLGGSEDKAALWAGEAPVEVASGRAERGPWRMTESHFDYVDDPAVAIGPEGNVGVAWVDQARRRVLFQLYPPEGGPRYPAPVVVSGPLRTFSWLPRLEIDGQGNVHALWQEIVFSGGSHGGEIYFARSLDGGASFEPPVNLSRSLAGDGKGRLTPDRWDNGSLALALGPGGRIYAAWTEYEGRLWVSRSGDGGGSFDSPVHVTGDEDRPARAPDLAVDASGTVHLAWSAGDQTAAAIHISMSSDGGRSFGAPRSPASQGHADAPKIAAGARGDLHLVWGEAPARANPRYRIRYARADSGGGPFTEPMTISGSDAAAVPANFPDLAIDAAGRLYVAWRRYPDERRASRGLGFTLSRDGGRSFARPEIVPYSDDPRRGHAGGLQGSLVARIAAGADGALALADSTFAPGRSSHVWLWRRPAEVTRGAARRSD